MGVLIAAGNVTDICTLHNREHTVGGWAELRVRSYGLGGILEKLSGKQRPASGGNGEE